MHLSHRVALLVISGLVAVSLAPQIAHCQPLVIGYERFHSETPSVAGGRLLFNELGCVNCHQTESHLPPRQGPKFEGLSARAYPEWIRAFLKNPAAEKPGSNMPNMQLSDSEIEAITQYISSLSSASKVPRAFMFVNAARGRQLYHKIGCASCHTPELNGQLHAGAPGIDSFSYPDIPFPKLSEKYDIHSLSAYLYEPHQSNAHGRMPQFSLDREDGGDIAAYLLNSENGAAAEYPQIPSFETDPELAQKGKAVVRSRNCAACHELPAKETIPQPRKHDITLQSSFPADHPQYNLSANQKQSIDRFLASENPPLHARDFLESLNCIACHSRGRIGGPDAARQFYFEGDHDLGDTGRFPPPLTDAGRKFKLSWLEEAIAGKKRIRPYLHVQMPRYGRNTVGLTELLAKEDRQDEASKVTDAHLDEGRKLLGTQGGLGCITCHGWEDRRSLGISAINLGNLHERLQPDWLQDYLINPDAHRPNTLMPSFWPEGRASNQGILDGNTKAQINAIYSFSQYGAGLPEGFPSTERAEYEIVPVDRPIVQRSFLDGVGTHGLLVGFPDGVHFAFDGQSGSPAMMWKGRFFDAYTTWFSRFPKFEKPLGDNIIRWDPTDSSLNAQYRGYRFGNDGIPEFLIEIDGEILYERIQPEVDLAGKKGARRTVRYTSKSQWPDPRLSHPQGVKTIELEDNKPMTRTFLYQW